MTPEDKKVLDEAKTSYSEACKMYWRINLWYKRLKNPSPEDELVLLSIRKRMSNTGKALYDIRAKIEGEQIIAEVEASYPQSIEDKIQSILAIQGSKMKQSEETKVIKEFENNQNRKQKLIALLRNNADMRVAAFINMDKWVVEHGWADPYGERLSPEQWEEFKKEISSENVSEETEIDDVLSAFEDIDKKQAD